jgi:tetratricopeptide (TPR) repeat protein
MPRTTFLVAINLLFISITASAQSIPPAGTPSASSSAAQAIAIDKNKVMDFFQNQQFDEAINYLSPAATADSSNLQLLGWLGYANYMNDNNGMAEQCFGRMFTIDSTNLGAIQYLAILNSRQDPDKARAFTLRLINLQPAKAVYYRNMGDLLRRTNQRDSALPFYNRAYELAPNDLKNASALAETLVERRLYTNADSILNAALIRDSLNIPCLKLRVRSAYEQKAYADVLIPGERLVRLAEPALNAVTQLALAYYGLKLYDDCVRVCEYMTTAGMSVESTYYYEAKACAKLKDYARSNELLRTCLTSAISPAAEWYYDNLGENFEELKQYRTAIAQYDTAYYLFKDPVMKYNNGRIYEANLKNMEMARKYYLQYISLAKPKTPEEMKAYEYTRKRWGRKKK